MQQYCVRSWRLIRLSTIANFHAVLRVSSWTNTTSSFLIDCLLDPVFLWNSRRDVRYSCFHRYQNCCRISACLLALCFRSKSSPKVRSVTSSSISGYASGVILRPYRCEGVNGSSSTTSPYTYVMGRSFRMASTSTARVWSSVRVIRALPSVFLMARLDSPRRPSQNLPYHCALLGINCHSTPCPLRDSFSEGDWKSCLSSSAAVK